MNKSLSLGAVVVLVLVVLGGWVAQAARATAELESESYVPFTDLRLLAVSPTPTPDRHDRNVGRYLQAKKVTQETDRHDLNVGRYLKAQTGAETLDRHDRNVLRYIFENWGTK